MNKKVKVFTILTIIFLVFASMAFIFEAVLGAVYIKELFEIKQPVENGQMDLSGFGLAILIIAHLVALIAGGICSLLGIIFSIPLIKNKVKIGLISLIINAFYIVFGVALLIYMIAAV